MNNFEIDVMKQTLELSQTIRAGLCCVQNLLEDGNIQDGFYMMTDVLEGMSSIRRAMPVILNSIPNQGMKGHLDRLRDAVEYMEESCVENPDQAWAVIETTLMPAYDDWQEEMFKQLGNYTLS